MYAIIKTGGKQYKVQNGDVIYVEKLAAEENAEVSFQVVALGGENGLKIGTPYVDGASVAGKVLKTGKAKAIRFSTLNAICRELKCQPGDILEYEEGTDDAEDNIADKDL